MNKNNTWHIFDECEPHIYERNIGIVKEGNVHIVSTEDKENVTAEFIEPKI